MQCKACNTPLPGGGKPCPSCGRATRSPDFVDRPRPGDTAAETTRLPPLSPSTLGPKAAGESKAPSKAPAETERPERRNNPGRRAEDRAAADLRAALGQPLKRRKKTARPDGATTRRPEEPAAPSAGSRSTEPAAPRPAAMPPRDLPKPAAAAQPEPQSMSMAPVGGLFTLEPAQLRVLLAEQPELLEPGLAVHVDDTDGAIGTNFQTDVGPIDLLACDEEGALVVVMVAEPDSERDIVPELLMRIGWVRKNLTKQSQPVRGMILTDQLDERLQYAAAAVADTLEVKRYCVSLAFERVDL